MKIQDDSDSLTDPKRIADPRSALNTIFPSDVQLGECFEDGQAFMNYDGGWAEAERGVAHAIEKVLARGGKVIGGKKVEKLLKTADGVTNGVLCSDESKFEADLVVIATGPWTASSFPELNLGDKCLATG